MEDIFLHDKTIHLQEIRKAWGRVDDQSQIFKRCTTCWYLKCVWLLGWLRAISAIRVIKQRGHWFTKMHVCHLEFIAQHSNNS